MSAIIKCPNCGTEFELSAKTKDSPSTDQDKSTDQDQGNDQPSDDKNEGLLESTIYRCEDCGAEMILDDGDSPPTNCPECDSTNISEVGQTADTDDEYGDEYADEYGVDAAMEDLSKGSDPAQVAQRLLGEQMDVAKNWSGDLATATTKLKSVLKEIGASDSDFDLFISKIEDEGSMKLSAGKVVLKLPDVLAAATTSFKKKDETGEVDPESDAKIRQSFLKYF